VRGMSIIVKTVVRLIAPAMLLVGVSVALHGHLTPGGGFQGGVMLGSTFLLLLLAFGLDFMEGKLGFRFGDSLRGLGAAMILLVGLLGLTFGFWFFSWPFRNEAVYLFGVPSEFFSSGNLLLYDIGEAIHVAAAFLIVFYCFARK